MKVVLTGGGTGGHIYPAVSVGQALRDIDPRVELLFVGSSHGPEGEIAKKAGIEFKAVPSSPLTKNISLKNAASFIKLAAGVFRARRILAEFKPDAVIGTGGYTTGAVLIAAWSLLIPIVIHEQNTVPGRTNLALARIAKKVCVTFESSASYFPKEKVVLTGMPIRMEFSALQSKHSVRRELGLDENAFTILAVGGSQGAKKLNELVLGAWPLLDDGSTQVLHQVGERNLPAFRELVPETNRYKIEAYLDMPMAVACADLVIARSGASTIAEITAAGLPSVLVPYPFAYANHQKHNAEYLAMQGAAILCEESVCSSNHLVELVKEIRSGKIGAMGSAAASLGKPNAARNVAEVAISAVAAIRKSPPQ